MVCPICDAEVYEHDVESCWVCECETPLTSWEECHPKGYKRPLVRCCRCGECPSPGDRACRQCQARFLKRVPAWLDAEFPGWTESDEWDAGSTFSCISCDLMVALGRAQCETCGLNFHIPTEHSLEVYEPGIGMVTLGLEADEGEPVAAPCTHAEQEISSAPAAVTPPCTPPPASVTDHPDFSPVHDLAHKTRPSEGITAAVIAAHVIPSKARLLTERQTSYKTLIASGSIRPVPGVKWLSGQSVICVHGHRSNFGLFACLPGYGTLDNLPENDSRNHNWLGLALHRRGGAARDNINDRDPSHDVRWQLGCPMCGTNLYTFEAEALREYVMCTASPDLFWVFCHLYRRDLRGCGNCEIRKVYWEALQSLE